MKWTKDKATKMCETNSNAKKIETETAEETVLKDESADRERLMRKPQKLQNGEMEILKY